MNNNWLYLHSVSTSKPSDLLKPNDSKHLFKTVHNYRLKQEQQSQVQDAQQQSQVQQVQQQSQEQQAQQHQQSQQQPLKDPHTSRGGKKRDHPSNDDNHQASLAQRTLLVLFLAVCRCCGFSPNTATSK